MRRYREKNLSPPGGKSFYTVPETGAYFEHVFLPTLIEIVAQHYRVNELEVPDDLDSRIENYVCNNVPETFCTGEQHGKRKYLITASKVRDFTRIMLGIGRNQLLGRSEFSFVDHKEAERRAKICETCEFNSTNMCTTCTGLAGFVSGIIGKERKTSRDKVLHVCEHCGCLLRAKIHVSKDILRHTTDPNAPYPDHCWMKDNGNG